LKRQFENPPAEFRLAPFWFWNHELSKEELAWQIQEMHRKGVHGFIMHARHGLITPYLSDEWFDCVEAAVREAERLGMKVYLYDEDNWPSGPASGRVIEENPEFRMSHCALAAQWRVRGPAVVRKRLDMGDELLSVVAVPDPPDGFPRCVVDLRAQVSDGRLDWRAPAGEWNIFVFTRRWMRGTFFGSYLDTLNPAAVKRFIEVTHDEYFRRLGPWYGRVVEGIFTDEPSMNYNPDDSVPWTGALAGEFAWRKGHDVLLALPALFRDMGGITGKVRCDFWDTATQLYADSFFRQIYEHCDARRLKSIGHVDCEGELFEHARQQGDFFRGARWMHYGGVDVLCELTWPENLDAEKRSLNNLLGPKFASSAAHLLGKPRVMSECFGLASQWGVNLRTLKWMTDWQVALGVNLLEPHAFYYSIQGFRKWECPPDEFYRMPFWPYYRLFADYAARLCALFSGSQHLARVAVLYPNKSVWAAMSPDQNSETRRVARGFEKITKALLRIHRDFDILPEEIFNSSCANGAVEVRGEDGSLRHRFEAVILPPCTVLSAETARNAARLFRDGGTIVVCGPLPQASSERGFDPEPASALAAIFGGGLSKRARATSKDGGRAAYLLRIEDSPEESVESQMEEALSHLEPLATVLHKGAPSSSKRGHLTRATDITTMVAERDGAILGLLVNTSRDRAYQAAEAVFDFQGEPKIWDARTGEIHEAMGWRWVNGRTHLPLNFAPTESFVISLHPSAESASSGTTARRRRGPSLKPGRKRVIASLDPEWDFSCDRMNALPLSSWSYEMRSRVLGRDSSNASCIYTSRFEIKARPARARLLIDGLLVEKVWRRSSNIKAEVMLNGRPVDKFEPGQYLDHYILEADVGRAIRRGLNELVITTRGPLYEPGSLKHPPILVGDFSLEKQGDGWIVGAPVRRMKTGSWTEQGYPFYSGTATLAQQILLPSRGKSAGKLFLELEGVADLAEVIVNGQRMGVMAWEPWHVEITDAVKPGPNRIEVKVTCSMQNLIVGEPKPSGLLGLARIVQWSAA
jgi:hypothetical protein